MLRIAFKEWAAVCRALATGRQSIILRKGGIAEQGGAFRPEHNRFWLYPTHYHEQRNGLKPDALSLLEHSVPDNHMPGVVWLQWFCDVTDVWFVDRLESVLRLDVFHIWSEETIRQRFAYRTPGLYVLAVRVSAITIPYAVLETVAYAGCRTWVELETELQTTGETPVRTHTDYEADLTRLRAALDISG